MLFALLALCCSASVVIEQGQLIVAGSPYKIRGICYSPVPIGESVNFIPFGDYFTPNYAYIWSRDLPRIKQLGFNTLRIYGWNTALNHELFLDVVESHGLKVMITFFLGTSAQNSVLTSQERQGLISEFAQEAQRYGNHSAVLMWSFGNELNGDWNGYIKQFSDVGNCDYDSTCFYSLIPSCLQKMKCTYLLLFQWINDACSEAKKYSSRPCTSGFADVDFMLGGGPTVDKITLFDQFVPHLDLWAMQVYRGDTFGGSREDFFEQYRSQNVHKPVIISEYGLDAYNDPCGWAESQGKVCTMLPGDPRQRGGDSPNSIFIGCPEGGACAEAGDLVQAEWDVRLASAVNDQLATECAGGFLMSWSDEYWKGSAVQDVCQTACDLSDISACRASSAYNQPWQSTTQCTERAHFTCNNWNSDFHDLCGYYLPGASYDNYVNEEWFGITKPLPCSEAGNFGAYRLDGFTPRNATGLLAALYGARNISSATCASLFSCHQCSIGHTAQKISQGICNQQCNISASVQPVEWTVVKGSSWLLLGLVAATVAFAGIPLFGFCWRYSKRQAVAKLFPGESETVPTSPLAPGSSSQSISEQPFREPGSNMVVLGLMLNENEKAKFVYYSKLTKPPDLSRIAGIGEPFALALSAKTEQLANINMITKDMDGAMLLEHVHLQVTNLSLALSHEIRNCVDVSQAIGVLHYRMFEAYMCWLEKHRFAPQKTGNLVAEIVVLRVIQSLCDHILHCPERISQIIHIVFAETIKRKDGVFVLDLDFIQEGLSSIHKGGGSSERGVINFDDINQAGATNATHIRKSWYESKGVGVCMDILRVEYPVLFVKGWIFAFVIWLQLVILHNKPPMFENLDFWLLVAHLDSIAYLAIETLLFVYTVLIQERYQSYSSRSWYRLFGMVLSLVSAVWMWVHFMVAGVEDELLNYVLLFVYIGVLRVLMFLIYLPTAERWFGRDSQFVRYGRPLWARKFRRRTLEQLMNRGAGLSENLYMSMLGNLSQEAEQQAYFLNTRRKKGICGFFQAPCAPENKQYKTVAKKLLFWFVVLFLTVALEFTIVSPIALGFTFHPMCDQSCGGAFEMLHIDVLNVRCVACTLSLFSIYSVITISCLVDIHFVFQFVLAIVGFCMGNARGLSKVLHANSLFKPSTWSKIPHAMLSLFGSAEHAEEVWRLLLADLLARDLISHDQCDTLSSTNLFDEKNIFDGDSKVINQLLQEPRERLVFFLKTLPVLANQSLHPARSVRDYFRHGTFHYDEQEFCASIPTLSQVVTTYTEEVIKSCEWLRTLVGYQSNLEYLIDAHAKEWDYFERRMFHEGKKVQSVLGSIRGRGGESNVGNKSRELRRRSQLLSCFLNSQVTADVEMEIRLWASYRTQTVARTLRGALTYHSTLATRLMWAQQQQSRGEGVENKLELKDMVELVVAAQTYGQRKDAEAVQRRQDLDYLLTSLRAFAISIVFDFCSASADLEDARQVGAYWAKRHGGAAFPFMFATVVKGLDSAGNLELRAVLPRHYPLRLGKGAGMTQGKAANHLNALRKVWGHVTQVLDANMDAWIGEAFKVPFITHMFLERSASVKPHFEEAKKQSQSNQFFRPMYSFIEDDVGDENGNKIHLNESEKINEMHARKTVVRRIIGFREFIFTSHLGGVATIMANSEKAFGTITQRVLDHPLGVRMHYGHPDFFDSFWMLNRGGPSKASPNINLSEDIFSGFNVWLRDEVAAHVDTIEWQKGREEAFTTASMFMCKITAGSVGILRTREFMHMNHGLDIITKLSLFCGGVGYYLAQFLVSAGIQFFAVTMFLLTFARVSIDEIRLFDAVLSIQWVLGFGLCTALPLLSEELLERGICHGLLEWIQTYIQGTVFYLFQNQGVAHAFVVGARTGLAPYANTGRPSFFSPYSKELAYRLYVESHYYPAYFILSLVTLRLVQIGTFSATLAVVSVIVIVWILAPTMFCPLSFSFSIFRNDISSSLKFLFSWDKSSLWQFWLDTNRKHYSEPRSTRCLDLCTSMIVCTVLFALDGASSAFAYSGYLAFFVLYGCLCSVICCLPRCRKFLAILVLLPLPFVFIWSSQSDIYDSPILNNYIMFGAKSWRTAGVGYGQLFIRFVLVYRAYKIFLDMCLWILSLALTDAHYRNCIDACYFARCSFHCHLVLAGITMLIQNVAHALKFFVLFPCNKLARSRCLNARSKNEPLLRDSING